MPRILIETLADFTGGLNLRANAFSLAANESPELLNVDVDPRGGFRLRGGVTPWGSATAADVSSLMPMKTVAGTYHVVAQVGSGLAYSTGAAWTTIGAYTLTGPCRSTVFKDRMYIVSGHDDDVVRWDGASNATPSAPTYNDNLAAPTASGSVGHVPRAKCIATHMGSVFVANTIESGTAYGSRVRWSHPNFPEDWRTLDFIDIDTGHDGDEITALVPFGDRLLVFKKHSIHAIYGEPPENLAVYPVSHDVGAPSQEAVVSTDVGVYFYSIPDGVFLYQGKEPQWVFERLKPATQVGGGISASTAHNVQLGWGNRRLWVSVPWEGGSARDQVFVLDPSLSKSGSWVQYDLAVGPFLEWSPPGSATTFVAYGVGRSQVLQLDVDGQPYDEFVTDVETPIAAHLQTRWVDLRAPAVNKRWKRPQVVITADNATVITVDAMSDYDPTSARRHFTLTTPSISGSGMVWGTGLWGVDLWGDGGGDGRTSVERGSPLGNGKAVALRFTGPEASKSWGIDAITFTYIPKKVR